MKKTMQISNNLVNLFMSNSKQRVRTLNEKDFHNFTLFVNYFKETEKNCTIFFSFVANFHSFCFCNLQYFKIKSKN